MAWPQAPQPAPTQGGGSQLSLGPIITAVAGVLTFLFSFVRIYKVDERGFDTGWSVWTTDFFPGLFGVGTWIPLLALAAGALALARAFVPGLAEKAVLGFTLLQLQIVAAVVAFLLWFGFLVSILLSGGGDTGADLKLGLGMLLLLIGLAGVLAGTGLTLAEDRKGPAGAPGTGQWQQQAPAGDTGQWQQAPPPQQWQQPQPPQPQWDQGQQPQQPQWDQGQQWQQQPQQPQWDQGQQQQWQPPQEQQPPAQSSSEPPWQPQPAPPGPVPEPGPADPQPAPPVDPQPEPPGGGLFDPGTQVIPGPPPAPPADERPDGPPPPPAPPASAP